MTEQDYEAIARKRGWYLSQYANGFCLMHDATRRCVHNSTWRSICETCRYI